MALVVSDASSSSPPSSAATPRLCRYHVFLSFRGEDTRKSFTDHLYAALERKGIETFRDDKCLETGEVISDELVKAIEESMFAITVLSPNYASSSWCLDELCHIVECSKSIGLAVVPVFYGVEPSDVRYQRGSFEEAFKKHERRFGEDSKKVRKWRDVLAQVATLSGWDSKDQHEATLVECIAEHIHKKMIPKLPSFTRNLIGIDSRVKEVISHIGIGLNDVHCIGIWGMGGIGKTTVARAVYEVIQCEFRVSCFLGNVREECERNNIVEMQRKLIAHADTNAYTIQNEFDGRRKIEKSFCNRKVLLVLDDVSDEDQLKNLVGEQNWFGSGSRIIITTRNVHLLNLKIPKVYQIYEVQGLAQNESFDLFCLKAFKQKSPIEGYLDLSKEVVKYSGGLPLALEVLGSHLFGRPIEIWHSAIKKIKSNPLAKIYDRLKISYEGLDDMEKHIFLDIACFFKGMSKYYVADVLNKCGYSAEIGIDILIDRSLVTENENFKLDMHDLLQDMGRSIVIQESPIDLNRRSRLWSSKDIDMVLINNKGTEKIQSIVFYQWKAEWCARDFSNMTQLKLLIMHSWPSKNGRDLDMRFPDGLNCFPTSLKVLHLPFCYPLKTLPLADGQQYELVEIKVLCSKIEQAWQGKKFLPNLKYLDLTGSHTLKETPDLSAAPVLETLVLELCTSLKEVHPSVAHHKKLTILNLTGCRALTTLPGKLEMSSLSELILDYCDGIQNLPEFGECMKSLSRLSLMGLEIRELPASFACLVGLKELNLAGCYYLQCLRGITDGLKPLNILGTGEQRNLPLLTVLNLSGCCLTETSFPPDFGRHLQSLMDLDLSGNRFVNIPINIHELRKLQFLKLNSCSNLRCLPAELPSSIRFLEARHCRSLDISDECNTSLNVCRAFVSRSQDDGQVLREMVISGREIPSWFVHRQDGYSVSIPCCDYPLNQRLGIALCFLIQARHWVPTLIEERVWVVYDANKRLITNGIAPTGPQGVFLYIICLTNDYSSGGFHQGDFIEFSLKLVKRSSIANKCGPSEESFWGYSTRVTSAAARWVNIEDIRGLNKSEIEEAEQ